MTELQQVFLFYVFIYYLVKGGLCVALYLALIVVEKHARQRHEQIEVLYKKKRAAEKERWNVAYSLYEKQKAAEPTMGTNPKSVKLPRSMVMLNHAPARAKKKRFTPYGAGYSGNRVYSIVS